MRLAFLTSVAASLLLGSWVSADTCGLANQPCCSNNFCSHVDAVCVDGICTVAVPGEGKCTGMGTKPGELCCNGNCSGEELACSEGTCVDVNEEPVLDQSGPRPGQNGGRCIGADQVCDEDEDLALECVDGFCKAPDVVTDQSVRSLSCCT
jgi:hypothetical protein